MEEITLKSEIRLRKILLILPILFIFIVLALNLRSDLINLDNYKFHSQYLTERSRSIVEKTDWSNQESLNRGGFSILQDCIDLRVKLNKNLIENCINLGYSLTTAQAYIGKSDLEVYKKSSLNNLTNLENINNEVQKENLDFKSYFTSQIWPISFLIIYGFLIIYFSKFRKNSISN